jgi:hypothetical protein
MAGAAGKRKMCLVKERQDDEKVIQSKASLLAETSPRAAAAEPSPRAAAAELSLVVPEVALNLSSCLLTTRRFTR